MKNEEIYLSQKDWKLPFLTLGFLVLITLTSPAISFGAICSCDAPPQCGLKPTRCFPSSEEEIINQIFFEEVPKNGAFLKLMNDYSGEYGSPVMGAPFGSYSWRLAEWNLLLLYLTPLNGSPTEEVEAFELIFSSSSLHLIRESDRHIFRLKTTPQKEHGGQ